MLGVVKLVPVPIEVPPVAVANQLKVPVLAVAIKVTVPALHLLAGVVLVIDGVAFTVAITSTLLEIQPALALST